MKINSLVLLFCLFISIYFVLLLGNYLTLYCYSHKYKIVKFIEIFFSIRQQSSYVNSQHDSIGNDYRIDYVVDIGCQKNTIKHQVRCSFLCQFAFRLCTENLYTISVKSLTTKQFTEKKHTILSSILANEHFGVSG